MYGGRFPDPPPATGGDLLISLTSLPSGWVRAALENRPEPSRLTLIYYPDLIRTQALFLDGVFPGTLGDWKAEHGRLK